MVPAETKLVDRLRSQERDWRRKRWLVLLGSLVTAAGNGFVLTKTHDVLVATEKLLGGESLEAAFYLAVLSTGNVLLFCAGLAGLVHALRNWNGSAVRQLLILVAQGRRE